MADSMNFAGFSLYLAPFFGFAVTGLLLAAGFMLLALQLILRARGWGLRSLAFVAFALALLNPQLVQEDRQAVGNIAVVVIDRSASQGIAPRAAQTDAVLAELKTRLSTLPGMELRLVEAGQDSLSDDGGTRLFTGLSQSLNDVPKNRIAGVILVSDGQIHDVPNQFSTLGIDAPVHLLLSGLPDQGDRRLLITQFPGFGLVGQPVEVTLRIDDLPADGRPPADNPGGTVRLDIKRDGEFLQALNLPLGSEQTISLPLDHAGNNVFELSTPPGSAELTDINNRAILMINGVRDRLRVLLISGEPHAGERTWRNLLKSDPSVDLVHFTILRPPEKQSNTPVTELSLIAFPVHELFEIKLKEFDLIIFDRYRQEGLLPLPYLDNIANYVEEGGAILDSVDPDYAGPFGLYNSPLGQILPAEPTGRLYEEGFRPQITKIGRRHPVTAALPGQADDADGRPSWGRWFRQVDVEARSDSTVVMTGAQGRPLLILDRVGEGRVAQLLSDQIWLWSRGFEGGGPQGELLKRVSHWLMKEPQLEEEVLTASISKNRLIIERQSLEEKDFLAKIKRPDGSEEEALLKNQASGRATATVAADQPGLYQISEGDYTVFAATGALNPREFSDPRSSEAPLSQLVAASGGGIIRLHEVTRPDIRVKDKGQDMAGRDWLALQRQDNYLVTGASQKPVLPFWLYVMAGALCLVSAWWREGK